jgi:hypothetical protein
MVWLQTIRDRPNKQLIGDPMGGSVGVVVFDDSIPIGIG